MPNDSLQHNRATTVSKERSELESPDRSLLGNAARAIRPFEITRDGNADASSSASDDSSSILEALSHWRNSSVVTQSTCLQTSAVLRMRMGISGRHDATKRSRWRATSSPWMFISVGSAL